MRHCVAVSAACAVNATVAAKNKMNRNNKANMSMILSASKNA